MKWLVADSLSCPEQFFASHLDSYSHYLREAGEEVQTLQVPHGRLDYDFGGDIIFALDNYGRMATEPTRNKVKRIAQVAAVCNPMPWDVRKPDGSPAYDLILSSIPTMVEQARAAGCRAEFMKLCFDHRALVCSMGVKKDIDCLFVGTVDGNHVKRARVLEELRDIVTVMPPVWGRDYYRLVARAKAVLQISAEWAAGARNALRLYEGSGLGALVMTDGHKSHDGMGPGAWAGDAIAIRNLLGEFLDDANGPVATFARMETARTLAEETYIQRVPELLQIARSL